MNDKVWEIKTPVSNNLNTVERKITKGGRQAENLIIDLRFAKADEDKCVKALINRYRQSRRVKSLLIISKAHGLEAISKK